MAQVAPVHAPTVPPAGAQSPHVPSHDLDAEMSVLSAMLLAPTAIAAVSEHLKASDFYRRTHGVIFDIARGLFERGEPVDAITVTAKLEEEGQLELVGGRAKIHEIAAWASAAGNAAHYALIVRDHALIRRLADAGREITRLAIDRGEETNHLISQAEQALFEVSQAGSPGELRSLKEALVETFERVSHLYEQGASVTGVSSGFSELDAVTAGFQPGNLIILAARPSMGKSALGISIAANVVRSGTPCAFFTLEMSKQEVTQRLICLEGKIDSHKIRTGKLAEEDWSRLSKACATLEQVPMFLDDTPGLTLFELRSRAQTLKRREPNLGMIIVDYLQLMAMGGNVESRLQEVSSLSRGLKALAKDLDVPIIALSQLSRAVEQRTDKRPVLSDLRESGSIEQDADLVMFIYRDEYYNGEESEQQGLAEVHVAKHRNGPTETIKLNFVKRYAKFSDHRAA
jgi:replicative DNA helicase